MRSAIQRHTQIYKTEAQHFNPPMNFIEFPIPCFWYKNIQKQCHVQPPGGFLTSEVPQNIIIHVSMDFPWKQTSILGYVPDGNPYGSTDLIDHVHRVHLFHLQGEATSDVLSLCINMCNTCTCVLICVLIIQWYRYNGIDVV